MKSRFRIRFAALLTVLVMASAVYGCSTQAAAEPPKKETTVVSSRTYKKPPDAELRKKLSAAQYGVTQKAQTEAPFRNEYWDHHERGIYVDVATGEPLFCSKDKFDSGTGWPSFTRPIESGRTQTRDDSTAGISQVEVRSNAGNSHLGHVFDDGPGPAGKRYCINSASMRFVPYERLDAEGYGEYKALFEPQTPKAEVQKKEVAILAGGCFWGMQELLRAIPGVITTEVGYTTDAAGKGAPAESVKVTFDAGKLSYADLLERWYFRMHDPTTRNRQGNDTGAQYRSALFATSEEQLRTAEKVKKKVDASHKWPAPIVTEIVMAGPFKRGEEHHQDYLQKHPDGYTCHYLRD